MTDTFQTDSPEQTVALGRKLAGRFSVGDCVALIGELGAGKTVLVRGIATGLGVADEREIASPTYVLVHEYDSPTPVYHVDLYRSHAGAVELAQLAIEEMLADGVVLIEWADRAEDALPRPHWRIDITATGATGREFRLRRVS